MSIPVKVYLTAPDPDNVTDREIEMTTDILTWLGTRLLEPDYFTPGDVITFANLVKERYGQ